MSEVDAVASREVHVGDRDVDPLDLAGGVADLELGHILAGGQLGPAAVRGGRRLERRAAAGTGGLGEIDVRPAPVAAAGCDDGCRESGWHGGGGSGNGCRGGTLHGLAAVPAEVLAFENRGTAVYAEHVGYSVW